MEKTRTYLQTYDRTCKHCSKPFQTWNRAALYCSDACRSRASKDRTAIRSGEHWLTVPVDCGMCGKKFYRTPKTGPNKKYCSASCSKDARQRDQLHFKDLVPKAMVEYNKTRAKVHGAGSLWNRLRKRYPDLPKSCEARGCTESRVLDAAHKPDFKRNGAWRTMDRYERHMFWVLCPTCHKVLDSGIETAEQMGLS